MDWILESRILEWVAIPFSRGSSQPRNWTRVSCIPGGFFISWGTREFPRIWENSVLSAQFCPQLKTELIIKVYLKVWGRGAPILQHTSLMLEHQIKNSQSIRAWDLYIMLYIILHLSPKSSKVLNVPPSFILTTSSHLQWNINTVKLGRKRQYWITCRNRPAIQLSLLSITIFFKHIKAMLKANN